MEIWKFPLRPEEPLVIDMPQGAEVLHVAVQGTQACIWALVDPEAQVVGRQFRVVGTGRFVPAIAPGKYVGTFMLLEGLLVLHVFDEGEVQ